MSTIGGPGGIGGPKGPRGPDGASDVAGSVGGPTIDAAIERARAAAHAAPAAAASLGDIDALAAEVAAGRITPHEAIEQLVEATAGPGLGATERAELRELLTDLIANDPYLGGLVGRI